MADVRTKKSGSAKRGDAERRDRHTFASMCLASYVLLLVLGGLPRTVRPAVLDRPHYWAELVLWVTGIRPGIEVFGEPSGDDYKFRANCIRIDGVVDDAPPIVLYPASGGCHMGGLRLRVPPEDVALYRAVRRSWELRRGALGVVDPETSDYDLAAIGRAFCQRPELMSQPGSRVNVVWYAWVESYTTGARLHGGFVYFSWSCSDHAFVVKQWRPDDEPLAEFDESIVRFWGSEPWG